MSVLKSIGKIILEYNDILVRDLGFNNWSVWEPMILRIMDVLGVDSLKGMSLEEAHKCPGKKIALSLIQKWASERGEYWGNLVSIEESVEVTPYYDCREYVLRVKTQYQFLEELSSPEVYSKYDLIREIFKSEDYKILSSLDGIRVGERI